MQPDKPKINFLFPYRWVKEDKQFLGENLRRQVLKFIGGKDSLELLETVLAYRIKIYYQYHKPIDITLSKTEIQRYLKEAFPNAKCLSVDTEFNQHRSKSMLPVLDFRIYF